MEEKEMISVSIFIFLLALAFVLFIYSVVDESSRIFANVAACAMATWIVLGCIIFSITGEVSGFQSLSVAILLGPVCIIFGLYSVFLGREGWNDYIVGKEG
jgi:hypothetical protein